MDELRTFAEAISEARILDEQAAVRGLLVWRAERLFAFCQDNLGGVEGDRPDPRFAELQLRLLDRLSKWFRLEAVPVQAAPVVDEAADAARTRLLVASQLRELASRGGSKEAEAS